MFCFTVPYQRNTNIIRFCRYYILFKSRTSRGILEKVHSLVALWPFNAQQELFVLSIKFRMEYQEINQQSMVMMSSD